MAVSDPSDPSIPGDVAGVASAREMTVPTERGDFAALSFGDEGAPLILALHGFPDVPHGLAPLAPALVAAGYRVVAPYLRGYAPSPLVGPHDIDTLAADAAAIAGALSPGAAPALLGHDWGAAISYAALARHPGCFRAAVTLAVPHPLAFLTNTILQPAQLRRSWYMLFFQLPGLPEAALARGDWAFVERLWRAWSPGLEPPRAHLARVKRCLAASMPAPLAHYRAMTRPAAEATERMRAAARQPIAAPVLNLIGEDDGCIAPPAARGQERFFEGDFRQEIVRGCGHFMAIERPAEIARRALGWLGAAR
jgi:pimeloyl-ACP methyl ester carboxylesterase